MTSNGYCENGGPMCFQHAFLLLNNFLRHTQHLLLDFIVLPDHKNVTGEIACPMLLCNFKNSAKFNAYNYIAMCDS